MAELSDYMENKIIEVMRATTFTAVAAYVALFATDSGLEAGSLAGEIGTAGGYTRQLAGLSAASGGASSNTADITFPTATAAWGTITHCALMDGATIGAGNVFMHSALDASKTIASGDTFKVNAGDLDVSLA